MDDGKIILKELKDIILKFRNERDWEKFHTVKDLLLALNIELGELQELILWKDQDEIALLSRNDKLIDPVKDELADIFIYLIYLFKAFNIDISASVINKLKKNEKKYPIHKAKGRSVKYTEL